MGITPKTARLSHSLELVIVVCTSITHSIVQGTKKRWLLREKKLSEKQTDGMRKNTKPRGRKFTLYACYIYTTKVWTPFPLKWLLLGIIIFMNTSSLNVLSWGSDLEEIKSAPSFCRMISSLKWSKILFVAKAVSFRLRSNSRDRQTFNLTK